MTADLPGLAQAWKAFERSRDHAECDAVAVRLCVTTDPSVAAQHPDLAGTEFGMQDRNGDLQYGTPLPGGRLGYQAGIVAKRHRGSGAVRFVGPYASGPAGDEFVYMSWRVPGVAAWTMRLKLRLTALVWEELVAADANRQTFSADVTGRLPHDNTKPVGWAAGDRPFD